VFFSHKTKHQRTAMVNLFWVCIVIGFVFINWVHASYHINETELSILEAHEASFSFAVAQPHMVGITLIQSAAAKGAGKIYI
jgi:hypothetical protein